MARMAENNNAIDQGLFGYQNIMKEFYNYKPDKDDSEGRAIKNSFMANMIQSGFDAQLAKSMAQTQSSIAQSNMITAADLEQRNTSSNMQQEFNYGMQSMGAQYELQNKFADQQYNRDLGMVSAVGDQTRLNIGSQGEQDRLTTVTQGEQTRLNTQTAGSEQRKGMETQGSQDRLNIGSTGEESRKNIVTSGQQERETLQTQGQVQQGVIGKQGTEQRDTIKVTGDQQRQTDSNMGTETRLTEETKGTQQRLTDSNAATEGRKTIDFTDQIEGRKENRQSARSRAMARSF